MKIPILTNLIRHWKRKYLRSVMRGYRILSASQQLGKITDVKDALTTTRIDQCNGHCSQFIFGAGWQDAESVVRQYLLLRLGGRNFNMALLHSIGKANAKIIYPLPLAWRIILQQHGFRVDEIRSALLWSAYVALRVVHGLYTFAKQVFNSIQEIARRSASSRGKFAYFDAIGAGNLPPSLNSKHSHDIISWYQQWPGRLSDLDAICHSVKGVGAGISQGLPVVPISSPTPPLTKSSRLLRFVLWGILANVLALLDVLRGRWWHAFLMREAFLAALVRTHPPESLARDYLFHNSGWIYRPLWTYEAEKLGSRICFYFYSTNCEAFKRPWGYPKLVYGWQAATWPYYLVWDTYQADFVRRAVGERPKISVVGPIWFQTNDADMAELPSNTVAVFDVQPMRNAFYQTLGLDFEYYTPYTANRFLTDIYQVLGERGGTLALKRKRQIGQLAHPRYRQLLTNFGGVPRFVSVDPDISALRMIEKCTAVISMPFTSTALLAKSIGKPSIYYDPHGSIQKDDRAAHGIEVLCGIEELRIWLKNVVKIPAITEASSNALN